MKILIVYAMRSEMPKLAALGSMPETAAMHSLQFAVIGVGPAKSAEMLGRRIRLDRPDKIILTGFCGGIATDLAVGDFCIPCEVRYGDLRLPVEPHEQELLAGAAESLHIHYAGGAMETFDSPVLSRTAVASNSVAADMESYSVVRVAASFGIPASVIKVVSDTIPQAKVSPFTYIRLLASIFQNYGFAKSRIDTFFDFFARSEAARLEI
jgi:nucleoside phosphorylase